MAQNKYSWIAMPHYLGARWEIYPILTADVPSLKPGIKCFPTKQEAEEYVIGQNPDNPKYRVKTS